MTAGVDNSVVILDSDGYLKTDEIDSRVWGTTLVDATNGAADRIPTFTDSNTITGETNLTYDGSTLIVGTQIQTNTLITSLTNDISITGYSGILTNLLDLNWDSAAGATTQIYHQSCDVIRLGTAISCTAGGIYNFGTGGWVGADADATSTSTGTIGMAVETATTNYFITSGYVGLDSTLYEGTATVGSPVYVSTTAGKMTFTKPSGSGDVVRVIGRCVDTYSSGRGSNSAIFRFNPSEDWIVIP
jgi:hypothetical protein